MCSLFEKVLEMYHLYFPKIFSSTSALPSMKSMNCNGRNLPLWFNFDVGFCFLLYYVFSAEQGSMLAQVTAWTPLPGRPLRVFMPPFGPLWWSQNNTVETHTHKTCVLMVLLWKIPCIFHLRSVYLKAF